MSQIHVIDRCLPGSTKIVEDPLPRYRDLPLSRPLDDSKLLPSERAGFGVENNRRILPYRDQAGFSREIETAHVKTIVLENEHLKAGIYPGLGGRVAFLYDKDNGRDIVYDNPALRFADLALRSAWFSGGIEWNLGRLGHATSTCSSVFAAKRGDAVILWDMERVSGLLWSVELRLSGRVLLAYVRVVNPYDESKPFYWWTNTAIAEEKGQRIFSATDEMIYIDMSSLAPDGRRLMVHGRLPYIPEVQEGVDFSYPENFTAYSNEYFFQNDSGPDNAWEVSSYKDGHLFLERSSEALRYRKMFCWGTHQGGRHWRDYLSLPGKGGYIEVQAGFDRTQLHSLVMPAGAEWDFIQAFSGAEAEPGIGDGDMAEARWRVKAVLDREVPQELITTGLELSRSSRFTPIDEVLHMGEGWLALEDRLSGLPSKHGFPVIDESLGAQQQPWLDLLEGRKSSFLMEDGIPVSYMLDSRWEERLAALDDEGARTMRAVMMLDEGRLDEAVKVFSTLPGPFAQYSLAHACMRKGEMDEALTAVASCLCQTGSYCYVLGCLELLAKMEAYDEAWKVYDGLDDGMKADSRIRYAMHGAALALGMVDFLDESYSREPVSIREGSRLWSDGWFTYRAWKEAKEKGIPFSQELVDKHRREEEMPYEVDFRQG